ncbi:hypothetical protein [Streptomyces sp. NPDC048057]|uniref:hypothetical protein n=1 Tax=Streptomyces sp. NPDC048057 TaxID=3155628 RepID=UPI0033EC9081
MSTTPKAGTEAAAAAHELAEILHKYAIQHPEALVPFMTDEDLLEYDRLCGIIATGADKFRPREG